jgi:hypothetical protein
MAMGVRRDSSGSCRLPSPSSGRRAANELFAKDNAHAARIWEQRHRSQDSPRDVAAIVSQSARVQELDECTEAYGPSGSEGAHTVRSDRLRVLKPNPTRCAHSVGERASWARQKAST